MALPVGCRYVNDNGEVFMEQVPLPSVFAFPKLWQRKAERRIREVTQWDDNNSWHGSWKYTSR